MAVGLAKGFLNEIEDNGAVGPKSKLNSEFFPIYWTLLGLMRIDNVLNSKILLNHVAIHPKTEVNYENNFSMKISVSCQLLQRKLVIL